jgi:uncharacterized membrane protein YoaK (UPF0700 family)
LAETLQAPYTTPFLLTVTFSTAILDSMTYNRFETFASNQTGNTVFLALAAMHAGQRKLTLTLTSFAGFVGSGLVFGQLGAYFGEFPEVCRCIPTTCFATATVTELLSRGQEPGQHGR